MLSSRWKLYLADLVLLSLLHLPATLAQETEPPYSACSQASIQTGGSDFGIPVTNAYTNNAAVCNNKPYLQDVAQCIFQKCGQQDLSVTVGYLITGCISTGTPSIYTADQLIGFGTSGSSASASSAAATQSLVVIISTVLNSPAVEIRSFWPWCLRPPGKQHLFGGNTGFELSGQYGRH
jgi:hypothetical protein